MFEQQNFPHFLSQASSDEDVQILTRTVPKARVGKRQRALTAQSWKAAVSRAGYDDCVTEENRYEYQDLLSSSDKSTDGKDSGLSSSSNNEKKFDFTHLAPSQSEDDDFHLSTKEERDSGRVTSSADSVSSHSDDDTLEVIEEIIGFKNIPLNLETGDDSQRAPPERGSASHRFGAASKSSRRELQFVEKQEKSPVGAVGGSGFESFIPSGVPHLETGPIDHIDLDLLLDAFPQRRHPPLLGATNVVQVIPTHGAGDVIRNKGEMEFDSNNYIHKLDLSLFWVGLSTLGQMVNGPPVVGEMTKFLFGQPESAVEVI